MLAGVTVPVFDGGTRAAILEQAQTKADNAGLALIRTREEAVRQIVLANNAPYTSLAAYTAATAVASASKTTFDAALAAYRSGVGWITDATMAETQLLQARNASTDDTARHCPQQPHLPWPPVRWSASSVKLLP